MRNYLNKPPHENRVAVSNGQLPVKYASFVPFATPCKRDAYENQVKTKPLKAPLKAPIFAPLILSFG